MRPDRGYRLLTGGGSGACPTFSIGALKETRQGILAGTVPTGASPVEPRLMFPIRSAWATPGRARMHVTGYADGVLFRSSAASALSRSRSRARCRSPLASSRCPSTCWAQPVIVQAADESGRNAVHTWRRGQTRVVRCSSIAPHTASMNPSGRGRIRVARWLPIGGTPLLRRPGPPLSASCRRGRRQGAASRLVRNPLARLFRACTGDPRDGAVGEGDVKSCSRQRSGRGGV